MISNEEADDLIREARAGSASALGRLLDSYREYLLRIASRRIDPKLRPKLAPSDIVQGSMLVATQQFPQFRGNTEAELRAWLFQIVSSELIDGFRRFLDSEKRRTQRELGASDSVLKGVAADAETPSELASLNEDAAKLLVTIEALPDELREIVRARYLEGLTFPQLAERFDLPVTTCRRRWLEAVEIIGGEMGHEL